MMIFLNSATFVLNSNGIHKFFFLSPTFIFFFFGPFLFHRLYIYFAHRFICIHTTTMPNSVVSSKIPYGFRRRFDAPLPPGDSVDTSNIFHFFIYKEQLCYLEVKSSSAQVYKIRPTTRLLLLRRAWLSVMHLEMCDRLFFSLFYWWVGRNLSVVAGMGYTKEREENDREY